MELTTQSHKIILIIGLKFSNIQNYNEFYKGMKDEK